LWDAARLLTNNQWWFSSPGTTAIFLHHSYTQSVRSVYLCDNMWQRSDRSNVFSVCVSDGGKSLWCADSKMLHCNSRSGCVPIFTVLIIFKPTRFDLLVDAFAMEKDFSKALKHAFIKYNTSISSLAYVELFSAGGLIFDNLQGKMFDKNSKWLYYLNLISIYKQKYIYIWTKKNI